MNMAFRRVGLIVLWVAQLLSFCAIGQSGSMPLTGRPKIDSLEKELKNVSGRKKADLLNDLAYEWFSFDNQIAVEKANEAFKISENLNYDNGKARALIYKGLYERISGDKGLAYKNFREGIQYAKNAGDIPLEGYGYIQFASFFTLQGKYDSAFWCFGESYKILKDSLHPFQLSSLYKNQSILYGQLNEDNNQYKFLIRSLAIREKLMDPLLLSDIYLQLAKYYIKVKKFEEAQKYLDKADGLQPQLGGDLESLNALKYCRAVFALNHFKYTEALSLFNEVKTYFQENVPRQEYVGLLIDVAYILSDLGNYELSLSKSYEALIIADENEMVLEQVKILWQIGWVYSNIKQFDLAKEFANKSLKLASQNDFKLEASFAYNLLGFTYERAVNYDSALYFYNKALVLREELKNITRIASTLNNIGSVLERQEKYIEALKYQFKSLVLDESVNNGVGIAGTNLDIGRIYFKMDKYDNSLLFLNKAETYCLQASLKQYLSEVYETKSLLYEKTGDLLLCIKYLRLYNETRDSLITSSLASRIAGLQSEYSLIQKNHEIEILNKDKKIKESELSVQAEKVSQQRLIIVLGVLIFSLLIAALYNFYRNLQRVKTLNRTIQENSEEIQAQAEELQLSNQTVARINEGLEQMVEVRTSELRQAYKELDTFFYRSSHDFRRPLTTFMGLSEVAKITVKDEAALHLFEKVNETARSLDKMLIKLQSISDVGSLQLIYKEIFMNEIFSAAENTFRDELNAKDIRIVYEVKTPDVFYSYVALIKVIVDNLIENSIMFSDSGQVIKMTAETDLNGLKITVTDTGWGIEEQYISQVFDMYFRAHERSRGNGLGLYIVKKVLEKLSGTIELQSTVGRGTTVTVFFPHRVSQPTVVN